MVMDMKNVGQDTVVAEGRHALDERALAAYLAKAVPGFQTGAEGAEPALVARKFGYGQSNPTYLLETNAGQRYVLRKRPPGKLIKGAHAVDREFRVLRALGGAGYEVPRVHVLCEDESVLGTAFYVMEFVKGSIMDNALAAAPAADRRGILMSIVRSLAKLHSYDPARLGLLDKGDRGPYGRVGGFYTRQIATMERTSAAQVAGSNGLVPPMRHFAALLELFKGNMPKADMSCVIHGDWKPDNMILAGVASGEPRVIAVLDWELSTIGHPMSDLANLCMAYRLPKDNPMQYPTFDPSPEGGVPTEEEVHRAYCEAAGIPYPIADWSFYSAFACLRLSVIAQGVAMRAAKGQASALGSSGGKVNNQMVQMVVGMADYICDIGYDIMRKAKAAAPGAGGDGASASKL